MAYKKKYLQAKSFALKNKRLILRASAAAGLLAAAGAFILFGPPHLIELTETPQFCALCHTSQNGDWLHSSHRTGRCIDCHLPNNNVPNHYLWKSIDGGKDVFLHFSGLGDGNDTALTHHGKQVLQANCIRCHGDMVARINNQRACIDCHRKLSHRLTATTLTREDTKK